MIEELLFIWCSVLMREMQFCNAIYWRIRGRETPNSHHRVYNVINETGCGYYYVSTSWMEELLG